jgi:mono/diheme cytochrome c family protein
MKSLPVSAVLAVALLVGCDRIGLVDRTPSVSGLGGATGHGGSGGGSGGSSGSANVRGLPCEVQALMVQYCASCHGSPTSGGAPRSLMTYADLTRSDMMDPSITEAEQAMKLMQGKSLPMPPAPAAGPSASEMGTLQIWIDNGYPTGSCGAENTGSGGSGGGGKTGSSGTGGSTGIADAGVPGGTLPCDVQTLLVKRCTSCHGNTPSGGAPRPLVSYANLTASDPANPALTEAEVAVQRMKDSNAPMPPYPASPSTSDEIATLQAWIDDGYPSGSCTGDAGSPPANDPLNADPTCTSNTTWKNGTRGSASMEPGQACISCHATTGGEAPTFTIAGTLYPTGHEPDNCNGANGQSTGAKVVVTGNNGSSLTLTPNSVGNFFTTTSLPPPYKAKVVSASGSERVMSGTASTGDCNSCHTQNGSQSAPGRITLPY